MYLTLTGQITRSQRVNKLKSVKANEVLEKEGIEWDEDEQGYCKHYLLSSPSRGVSIEEDPRLIAAILVEEFKLKPYYVSTLDCWGLKGKHPRILPYVAKDWAEAVFQAVEGMEE
jgi:hypothetical protein